MTYLKKRLRAFGFAFTGLKQAFKNEPHVRLHTVIAGGTILISFYFNITRVEWLLVLACIAMVISMELINSAIEKLCDLVTAERNPAVKYIKDVCAGAVLIVSLVALVVATFVFLPYLTS